MTRNYHLIIQPSDGPTLKSDTVREWEYDNNFVVIETDYMPFENTWREQRNGFKFIVTRRDILDAEHYHDIHFDIKFVYQTVKQHFTELAETDNYVATRLNLEDL